MIEKNTIPVPTSKGLYLDGVSVPGGLSKAENVIILQDGTFERRLYERTLAESPACLASRGLKNLYELQKSDGVRYLFADVDQSDTIISSFGAELVDGFASWNAVSGWTYGSTKWTHTTGTTALTDIITATPDFPVVATTQYRIVADVTCAAPSSSGTYWAYTITDSTYTWTNFDGGSNIIWSNKWTHGAGGTTAITAVSDFTPVAGQSYRISVYVTHTSGTDLSVYIGGTLAGVISSTGQHELVATFVSDATALRFVPSSNWVGVIESTTPQGTMAYNRTLSIKKFIDPAGANTPSNLGDELLSIYGLTGTWYPEATASSGQSLTVFIGGTAATAITDSGVYTFDLTAATTANLTFTPTTAWDGSVNSVSVKVITYGSSGTKTKVIGGVVTGTTDYDVSWANILTDLTADDAIQSSWATLQDRAFRVDGINLNYWFTDASGYHSLGVPAPADAPITASTTGGELTAGAYNIYYTYVKKDGDYVVEGNPSTPSNITIAGTAITVSVIALTDPDVTHIRIYRTLHDEMGSDAYLALEVNNATATHTLILADDIIGDGEVLEYGNDRPPVGKFVLGAGSRLWLIDTVGLLHWSKLDYPEQMPATDVQSFDPKDGDEVMGMCALRSNLLVFKRRRTWLMNMFSQSTDAEGNAALSKEIVSSTLGCIATGSIQSAGQESAIWLSAAGFILYDGGTFRNISGGDIQTGTPSRIQSVINDFMKNGAEKNITSTFHSVKQLYHVNFLYRTGSEVTNQRHFVYNLITDTWTEYIYRDDLTQARLYVTNIALGHDSLGNEIVLTPYLSSTDGELVYIHQNDYEPTWVPAETTLIFAQTGGIYTFCDSSDNVYIIGRSTVLNQCAVYKITSADVSSTLVSAATLNALSWPDTFNISNDIMHTMNFISDVTNSRMFIQYRVSYDSTDDDPGSSIVMVHGIFKISTTGVITQLSMDTISGSYIHTKLIGMKSDSSLLYVLTWDNYRQTVAPTYFRFSSMNVSTGTLITLYSFTGITAELAEILDSTPFSIYDGSLYWYRVGNLYVLEDFDTLNIYATDIDPTYLPLDIYVDSAEKIFLVLTDSTKTYSYLYSGYPNGIVWNFNTFIEDLDPNYATPIALPTNYHNGNSYKSRHYMIHKNTAGYYILEGLGGQYNGIALFYSDWSFVGSLEDTHEWPFQGGTVKDDLIGVSWYLGTAVEENKFICNGGRYGELEGTWRIIPYYYWDVILDSSLIPVGTIADIVSNYIDLGMPEEKRVNRVYLDTMSKYPSIGKFAIESNYNINYTIHVDDETTEPDGSVSRLTFGHPGEKTWNTTNTFDSTVEPWRTHRIDVGLNGQAFRYSIKVGDIAGSGHGLARIRLPRIVVQMKGKP